MNRIAWCLIAFGLLGTACKKKSEVPPPATAPAVVVTSDAATAEKPAAPSDLVFGTGEGYWGGSANATNVLEWKLEDGTVLKLVIVSTRTADGRKYGVLRVYRDGKGADIESFSVASTGDSWAELKQLPNGRVSFRYGDASDDRHARNVSVLRYDNSSKAVVIARRWNGPTKTTEPEWLLTDTAPVPKQGNELCAKIVARIAACQKDAEFRTALFVRDDESKRAELDKQFDAKVTTWKKAGEVQKVCAKWTGPDVVETTFSDESKLEGLAKDAAAKNVNCGAFGREVVDEGGLPRE